MLLFSQFTMMLDIIEAYMKSRKYEYVRLDGATAVVERCANHVDALCYVVKYDICHEIPVSQLI